MEKICNWFFNDCQISWLSTPESPMCGLAFIFLCSVLAFCAALTFSKKLRKLFF